MRTKDQTIDELLKVVEEQRREIIRLKERISELERRLNLNSQNSSKPPSADGLNKPKTRSLREKGKNKTGGQSKHPGNTLYQTMEPDQTIVHKLDACPVCQGILKKKPVSDVLKRQIFDITIPKIEVTEHQVEVKCCHQCNQKVSSNFPEGVNAPVQYGARVKAFAIYLQNQHFLPEERLQNIFKDLFELPISSATLSNFSATFSSRLSNFIELVDRGVYKAKVKHLDETWLRVDAKPHWLHVASTEELTCYRLSRKRGDIPDKMLGIVVHDHWRPYFTIKKARHAVCNVHILRELLGIVEEGREQWAKKMYRLLRLEGREQWAKKMYRLLRLACGVKNKYSAGLSKRWIEFLEGHYFKIVKEGLKFHDQLPPLIQKRKHGVQRRRVGHNLLLRLEHYHEETLRFLYNPNVPFTNNQAEQDIRMMKVKQKISGCFRSFAGAETFCRVRSFLSTARKQGWNILGSIENVLNGEIPAFAVG